MYPLEDVLEAKDVLEDSTSADYAINTLAAAKPDIGFRDVY